MVAYEPPETLYSPRYSRDCESCPPSGAPRKRHAHRARPTLPMVAHTPTPTPGGPSGPNGPVPGDHRYAPSSANGRRPSACRGTKDGSLAGRGVYLWSTKTARADCHEPPQAGCDGFANHRYTPRPPTCTPVPRGRPQTLVRGTDLARGRLAPMKSPDSMPDRCSASTQYPPDLASSSIDLYASTSLLPQAGTKRQPARRTSGRWKLTSSDLAPLSRPLRPAGT